MLLLLLPVLLLFLSLFHPTLVLQQPQLLLMLWLRFAVVGVVIIPAVAVVMAFVVVFVVIVAVGRR